MTTTDKTLVEPLAADPARDATDSIRGYVYQIYQSTLAWLELDEKGTLYLERAEDFDAHDSTGVTTATQVKHTAANQTLRSLDVRSAIVHFWTHTERNPKRDVHLRYLTTAEAGYEKGGITGSSIPGLLLWKKVADGADVAPLRTFLRQEPFDNVSLATFLESSTDEEFRVKFLQRIHWNLGRKSIDSLIQQLEHEVAVPASTQRIDAIDAKNAVPHLLTHVVNLLTVNGPKPLTKADLLTTLGKAFRKSVSNEQYDRLQTLEASEKPLVNRAQSCPIKWMHGTTDDDTYVPRNKVLAELDQYVGESKVRTVTAHGIAGTGKTSLIGYWLKSGNALTTERFKRAFFWSFYSNRDVDELIVQLLEVVDPSGTKSGGDTMQPIERFELAARRVDPCLVVLDGVEVLQHRLNEGFDYGRFVDTRLQSLLEEVARLSSAWLVVCTSRFPLTDRLHFHNDRHIKLAALETDEAVEVLGHSGVRGPRAENERVVDALQGHPLALKLFAASLPRELRNEPKAHLDRLLRSLPANAPFGDKISRLVAFYSESIEPVQRLLLHTLSIFRSPVPLSTIELLATALAPSAGLNSGSVSHVAAQLAKLKSSGIVIHDETGQSAYSCHPVVLDSFRRELLGQPTGQTAINLLTGRPDDIALEGVSELEPLIIALEALNDVGDERTARKMYDERFENGRVFVRQGLPFEAVRVFDSFLNTSMKEKAPRSSSLYARQLSAERKFLVPAANFDISLGELRSAERRLNRALEVQDSRGLADVYRNLARVKYQRGDLLGAEEAALKGGGESFASVAIVRYYRVRALACSGEFQKANAVVSELCDLRYALDHPDISILEPMCKVFLALRTPHAVTDTTAITLLRTSTGAILDRSLRLEATLLHCQAKLVLEGVDMSAQIAQVEQEATTGQYSIRRCQAIMLSVYTHWRHQRPVAIDRLERIVSVAEDAEFGILQCEGLRILSLCVEDPSEQHRYLTQLSLLKERFGYTTIETALPPK